MTVIEAKGDIRTKAMFDAIHYSGMRVRGMLQLKMIEDIKGKGNKYRGTRIF